MPGNLFSPRRFKFELGSNFAEKEIVISKFCIEIKKERASKEGRKEERKKGAVTFSQTTEFFFKMGQPRPLFHLFLSFQTYYIFYNKYACEKCPSSRQCRDSNSRPLEHESPPITTRPGLPP